MTVCASCMSQSDDTWTLIQYYIDIIMSMIVSQITSVSIVCSTVCSGADQRKHQSSASTLAFVRGIHWWPVNSPHKGPVIGKLFVSIWSRHRDTGTFCNISFRLTKRTPKLCISGPFVWESLQCYSPNKGPVMWKTLPWHDIIINKMFAISSTSFEIPHSTCKEINQWYWGCLHQSQWQPNLIWEWQINHWAHWSISNYWVHWISHHIKSKHWVKVLLQWNSTSFYTSWTYWTYHL